jgi:NAD(P)H-hydrate epimerase
MGVGAAQRDLVQAAIALDKPLVVDADGLNNLARLEGWARQRACPLVLTPHPGEFARLTGKSVGEIQSDRENVAVQAARQWAGESEPSDAAPLVCVLKGAGTVVTDGERIYRNDTGNPGMASGGSGDILTGLTAALLGQGLEPFDAACLAVWAHGLAGDIAAEMLGEVSLMGWDLLDALPEAMKQAVEERD